MPPAKITSIDALKDSIGREIAVSDWIVVTQERIAEFAEATSDRQWIHLDRERAEKESPYGTTIAHGFLTLSLLSSLMQDAMQFEQVGRRAGKMTEPPRSPPGGPSDGQEEATAR